MKTKNNLIRIIIGVVSIGYVVFMWVKKDILSIYSTIPQEEALPLIITTIAVSLVKVVLLTGLILLIRWISNKLK